MLEVHARVHSGEGPNLLDDPVSWHCVLSCGLFLPSYSSRARFMMVLYEAVTLTRGNLPVWPTSQTAAGFLARRQTGRAPVKKI